MAGMRAALGAYPMTREASGTSWQPDASPEQGVRVVSGDWTLMVHGLLNGVYIVFGVGAQAALNFVGSALASDYGSDPSGEMGFVRLKIR